MQIGLSQECCLFCLFCLKSSLWSSDLPCLLATAILDSFSLFYLPNTTLQKQKQSSPLTSSSVIGPNGDPAALVIQREGKGRRSTEGSVSQASASRGSDQWDRVGLSRGFWGLDGALRGSHLDQRSGWFKVSVWWRRDSSTLGRRPGWGWGG